MDQDLLMLNSLNHSYIILEIRIEFTQHTESIPIIIKKRVMLKLLVYLCRDVSQGKIKIEFCMACSRRHSAGHFDTKLRCLAHLLTVILQILSFKTCVR